VTDEELSRDIVRRLREIPQSTLPSLRLTYQVEEIEFLPPGRGREAGTEPGETFRTVSVRVRDTEAGVTETGVFPDFNLGGLLETRHGEEDQRSAFAWLLHAFLDEWWLTGRGARR
jgi:hypothetical protein